MYRDGHTTDEHGALCATKTDPPQTCQAQPSAPRIRLTLTIAKPIQLSHVLAPAGAGLSKRARYASLRGCLQPLRHHLHIRGS